ncbi:hypothetical protein JTF06_06785 [Desemzia sp. RIT804]|uniref:hypothetical protein n=1 Tax=Desemzia sp. RIT 804 TaxID=2810209 RepID=UPI00194F1A71|nr:hypothetical protein [Desemzia sp. RIT 804]MBM6614592.1 hypothetical protein [Desemzia sp. RIT 804]
MIKIVALEKEVIYFMALVKKFPPVYGIAYGKPPHIPAEISRSEFLKGLELKKIYFLLTNVKWCRTGISRGEYLSKLIFLLTLNDEEAKKNETTHWSRSFLWRWLSPFAISVV